MSQPNAYGVLEYPDGAGSNPVKRKKKENNIFIFFFIHCFTFHFFCCCICLISLSTFLVIYLWSIIIHQCSWTGCFEMV